MEKRIESNDNSNQKVQKSHKKPVIVYNSIYKNLTRISQPLQYKFLNPSSECSLTKALNSGKYKIFPLPNYNLLFRLKTNSKQPILLSTLRSLEANSEKLSNSATPACILYDEH